ncbi:hypothetical protein SNOG_04992 [Parastagonospora nodorum SN15]|uniref:Uncharacterized protein n=1 Tax=Phaeosphaeria nodorum (strain SN15 / ATCC MYA-4574 / FGSC 10173) TaxID=321614 RepID=Q0UTC2_PHANO|nr:hypothetical protein SNOG_04992 [Parastagonospora nodorum SN15]EAT87383.1 hypothetical protein SNOG_04992 [Parastagonospora nodorum SN15]
MLASRLLWGVRSDDSRVPSLASAGTLPEVNDTSYVHRAACGISPAPHHETNNTDSASATSITCTMPFIICTVIIDPH